MGHFYNEGGYNAAASSNGSKLQYSRINLNRWGNGWNFTFWTCLQHLKLSRVAASLPVDGAGFSAVPCQKWTHSREDLLSSTPGEAHRGRRTRRALAVLTEASCVRGISLDRLPPPLFVARGGPRLMRGNARVHTQVRGAAVSSPSLSWQFVSTWRWLTQTARCIADLPGWRMVGWSGIMRRVKGTLFPLLVAIHFLLKDQWVTFSGLYWWERILQANGHLFSVFMLQI